MRLLRWALVVALVVLHLVMKAPVWALITHIDLTGSSSSYHRFYLVDNCIRHFSDWWLLGYKDYDRWGYFMFDLCDQFVVQAVNGGLLTLVAYIAIFTRSFGAIGKGRKRVQGDRRHEWYCWCLGSALFSVIVAHFGINYPAVMEIGLFTLWVCISVTAFEARRPVKAKVEVVDDSHPVPELVWAS